MPGSEVNAEFAHACQQPSLCLHDVIEGYYVATSSVSDINIVHVTLARTSIPSKSMCVYNR